MIRLGIILLIILLFTSFSPAYGQMPQIKRDGATPAVAGLESKSVKAGESATDSAKQDVEEINYELPYPGMLPDSPLYFLKTIRDAVVRFLISDPLKEAEFDILTSDKRIYASLMLAEKEKYELSLETLIKSNNYLHEAVFSISKAQENGKDIKSLHGNLLTSVKKHKEIVSRQLMAKFPKEMGKSVETELKRLENIEKSANSIELK